MTQTTAKQRPKNLDLTTIKLPLPGIVSILHRVTGAGMFVVLLPFALCGLQGTLRSEDSFRYWSDVLASVPAKLLVIALVWAYVHHLLAGIRFLSLDLHVGVDKPTARKTSGIVLVGGIVITLAIGALIW
jgi:succinate dehydrogenase / fumarate reductase, cytochrome b subunit